MTDNQIKIVRTLLDFQSELRVSRVMRYIVPFQFVIFEYLFRHFVWPDRHILASVLWVAIGILIYFSWNKNRVRRTLEQSRQLLYKTETGQAVLLYLQHRPGAFAYLSERLQEEFGLKIGI